jgi:hypothetical protein
VIATVKAECQCPFVASYLAKMLADLAFRIWLRVPVGRQWNDLRVFVNSRPYCAIYAHREGRVTD